MDLIDNDFVKNLIGSSTSVLLGVSGGIDSMVLLHWMWTNKSKFSAKIAVMHVNHRIHPDSDKWAKFVENVCKKYDFICYQPIVDVTKYGSNIEYAARKARYHEFCSTGYQTLMLAHHANDQCESFLLKLFRGSGIKGLKSMSAVSDCWLDKNVKVVRPLLAITREQIEAYASEHNLEYIVDPSNHDVKYDRNYVRNCIWPVIEKRFNIADINTVRSIGHLAEAWELTNTLADIDLNFVSTSPDTLDWMKVKNLGYLRVKNMIMRLFEKNNVYSFTIGHVEQFVRSVMVDDLNTRTEMLVPGLKVQKIGKRIIIQKVEKNAA